MPRGTSPSFVRIADPLLSRTRPPRLTDLDPNSKTILIQTQKFNIGSIRCFDLLEVDVARPTLQRQLPSSAGHCLCPSGELLKIHSASQANVLEYTHDITRAVWTLVQS